MASDEPRTDRKGCTVFNPWSLLGEAISVAMLVCAPFLWRRRGAAFGLRWVAVALVAAGLGLTGLLRLFGRVGKAFFTFFTQTALVPTVWVGYLLIAAAVAIWFVGRVVGGRTASRTDSPAADPAVTGSRTAGALGRKPRTPPTSAAAPDDEFADVEAILRRRGI